MSELDDLQSRLGALLRIRSEIVTRAQNEIADANADFDRQAIPINKRLAELKEAQPKPTVKRQKHDTIPVADPSWPPEVQRQFNESVKHGRGNR